ncbi:MAG TPA: GDSL-type esterase/lipase family protein [Planctomycetota bacterium]|jgi:lysophospholipase L1-like esterase
MKNFWQICPAIGLSLMVSAAEPPDVPCQKKNRDGSFEAHFIKKHESFVEEAKKGNIDLLLVGDFLTDDWRGNNKNNVKTIYDKAFGQYKPANFGNGGDYTQHVLWRLQNGELEGIKPKVLMLLIGGTNGSNNDPPAKIYDAIVAIVKYVQEKSPTTKILLLSVPPFGEKDGKPRARHSSVNPLLPKVDDGGKSVKFVDIFPKFLSPDGTVSRELMPDGVHFSDKGYQMWADTIELPLKEMMLAK